MQPFTQNASTIDTRQHCVCCVPVVPSVPASNATNGTKPCFISWAWWFSANTTNAHVLASAGSKRIHSLPGVSSFETWAIASICFTARSSAPETTRICCSIVVSQACKMCFCMVTHKFQAYVVKFGVPTSLLPCERDIQETKTDLLELVTRRPKQLQNMVRFAFRYQKHLTIFEHEGHINHTQERVHAVYEMLSLNRGKEISLPKRQDFVRATRAISFGDTVGRKKTLQVKHFHHYSFVGTAFTASILQPTHSLGFCVLHNPIQHIHNRELAFTASHLLKHSLQYPYGGIVCAGTSVSHLWLLPPLFDGEEISVIRFITHCLNAGEMSQCTSDGVVNDDVGGVPYFSTEGHSGFISTPRRALCRVRACLLSSGLRRVFFPSRSCSTFTVMDTSPYDAERTDLSETVSSAGAAPYGEPASFDGPVKLFVGQVPRSMEEEDLQPVLEVFGALEDLVIIRDKITGAHRGCAFASYFKREAAETAVHELHNKVTLPQSLNPLQVRPAEGQAGASQEHKLFIGMIPKTADEAAIRDVFELFGPIEEVYILRHPATGQSKGCAFLKFKERASALAAIDDVHGNVTMDRGTSPLVVKFADSRRQRLQRARNLAVANAYWPLPPGSGMAAFPQLQQMQQQYMQQMQAFGAQAVAGLNPAMAGLRSPLEAAASPTNSFMYYNPYGFAAAAAAGATGPYGFTCVPRVGDGAGFDMQSSSIAAGLDMQRQAAEAAAKATRTSSQLEGPTGANLFIYHLPHDLTDADLATAFAPFGTVISAKVYMDKITGESKGFGFVSYDSADAADAAIASMNGFQIGTKRLKVQHKRIHQRSDFFSGAASSLVGPDDELANLDFHHQPQQSLHALDDGLYSHHDETGAASPPSSGDGTNGVDASLDEVVQKLRIDS
ncbi:hypothetical protein PsorP6_014602 [Peronosclerospora sorghi]|uniref:Uncharacterized protein n=1 Tax=Peronosclerospora sorghi TaxID=230839 RepID=A0ACC0VT21_9STRA|nr:hypothetical protein PsorP6_014602 [Peronosclerospora sorghi]